jgi:Ku70/Ku80 beta-barrel domain
VDSEDVIKGYEVGKGEYLELDPEELEAVAIESKRVIDIDEFVPKKEIDELYLNNPYYIVPDGEVGTQAKQRPRRARWLVRSSIASVTRRSLRTNGKGESTGSQRAPVSFAICAATSPSRRADPVCIELELRNFARAS